MRKIFSFILKALLVIILLLAIAFGVLYYKYDQPIPQGTTDGADAFACQILNAINEPAYLEARYVEWDFRNASYKLDKRKNMAICEWSNYYVELHFSTPKINKAFKNGRTLTGNERQDAIEKATKRFNNDSFWVLAPFKLFDEDTSRRLVNLEDGNNGLLVKYASGGSTPGDSYLWKVDENHVPSSYQMWVSIIPIGGLEAEWADWTTTKSGTMVSEYRSILGIELPLSNIRMYSNEEDALLEREPVIGSIIIETKSTKNTTATKKEIIITTEMRQRALKRRFSQRHLERDMNMIRPILTEGQINTMAENIMLLMQTGTKPRRMTYEEILALRMRDSLF